MVWSRGQAAEHAPDTGVDLAVLSTVGKESVRVPEGFVSDDHVT